MSKRQKKVAKRAGLPIESEGPNLTPKMVARILLTTAGVLAIWRHKGTGPPFFKPSPAGKVLYPRAAFDEWFAKHTKGAAA